MEIKRLELEGFRGFKNKQEIIFPDNQQPMVFVGVNGAGKTALLDAIRAGLSPFYHNLLLQSNKSGNKNHHFDYYDINIDKKRTNINIEWLYPIEHSAALFDVKIGAAAHIAPHFGSMSSSTETELISQIIGKAKAYPQSYSLAVMVYYPSERLVESGNLDIKSSNLPTTQLSALQGALDSFIDFQSFFRWFRNTEDIENEQRLTTDSTFTEPRLEAVRKAIMSMLDGFTSVRVQRSPVTDMVVKKHGQQLSIKQLSSGEKAILTLAGDLAMRLALANPGLKNPLEGRGVVMIDEVDLHLHPNWQVHVVERLRQTFPKIQFILTTHSPLIINRLAMESLYFLNNNECFPATLAELKTYGANVVKVLTWQGVDNLLPKEIKEKINCISQLIYDNKITKAKELLDKLTERIDPNHPDLIDLMTDIEIKSLEA